MRLTILALTLLPLPALAQTLPDMTNPPYLSEAIVQGGLLVVETVPADGYDTRQLMFNDTPVPGIVDGSVYIHLHPTGTVSSTAVTIMERRIEETTPKPFLLPTKIFKDSVDKVLAKIQTMNEADRDKFLMPNMNHQTSQKGLIKHQVKHQNHENDLHEVICCTHQLSWSLFNFIN